MLGLPCLDMALSIVSGGVKAIALVKSNNLNCDSLQSVSCKESLFDAMQGTAATG